MRLHRSLFEEGDLTSPYLRDYKEQKWYQCTAGAVRAHKAEWLQASICYEKFFHLQSTLRTGLYKISHSKES